MNSLSDATVLLIKSGEQIHGLISHGHSDVSPVDDIHLLLVYRKHLEQRCLCSSSEIGNVLQMRRHSPSSHLAVRKRDDPAVVTVSGDLYKYCMLRFNAASFSYPFPVIRISYFSSHSTPWFFLHVLTQYLLKPTNSERPWRKDVLNKAFSSRLPHSSFMIPVGIQFARSRLALTIPQS